MGTDNQQGLFLNVLVGIIGASIGGFVLSFFGIGGVSGFNLYSFFVAVLGAVILLFIVKFIRG